MDELQNPVPGGTPAPGAGSTGHSEWEDRFKGQQRAFNELQAKYQNLSSSVEGKDTYAAQIAAQMNALEKRFQDMSTQYEGTLAQTRAEKEQIATQAEANRLKAEALENSLGRREQKDAVRRELAASYSDLSPWFESGYLDPKDDEGRFLSGDALVAHLNGFREVLAGNAKKSVSTAVVGGKPELGTAGASLKFENKTREEMETWLDRNPFHADWEAVEAQYLKTVRS